MSYFSEYPLLEGRLESLDITASNFAEEAARLRWSVDRAYESRSITLQQWRTLTEETALQQARFGLTGAEGWCWTHSVGQ